MLIFVVARTRLARYDDLRRQFADWRDVRVVLDRREGDRRTPAPAHPGADRRRFQRRHHGVEMELRKLGWCVVDTDEPTTGAR